MKRLFLMVVAMLSMTMAVNAENESSNNADVYTVNRNINTLVKFLELNEQQALDVIDVHASLCNDLQEAIGAEGAEKDMIVKLALKKNCMYMKLVLDNEQYTKYLRVLNATVNNRGLNK